MLDSVENDELEIKYNEAQDVFARAESIPIGMIVTLVRGKLKLYRRAMNLFQTLGLYKDASEKAEICRVKSQKLEEKYRFYVMRMLIGVVLLILFVVLYMLLPWKEWYMRITYPSLKNAKVGDYVLFGNAREAVKKYNGGYKEEIVPIEWRVLEVNKEEKLLLKRYAAYNYCYNTSAWLLTHMKDNMDLSDVKLKYKWPLDRKYIGRTGKEPELSWKDIDIRHVLNHTLYNDWFSEYEAGKIVTKEHGPNVEDYLFLLSKMEAEQYHCFGYSEEDCYANDIKLITNGIWCRPEGYNSGWTYTCDIYKGRCSYGYSPLYDYAPGEEELAQEKDPWLRNIMSAVILLHKLQGITRGWYPREKLLYPAMWVKCE